MASDDPTPTDQSGTNERPFCDQPDQRLGVLQTWQDEHSRPFADLSSGCWPARSSYPDAMYHNSPN
jgi:hypothetical protein